MTGIARPSCPTELSTIPPLPFWPSLKWTLRSHGAALLLIYLEVHFPASEASPSAPILVDVDRIQRDLRVCPKALWLASARIAARHPTTRRLEAARRTGREFYTRTTMGAGALKPYSYVPITRHTWELRRNVPRLRQLLASCAIPWPIQQTAICEDRHAAHDGFHPFPSNFAVDSLDVGPASGAELAREMSRSIAGLGDSRRKTGLKRKPHTRSAWTDERRAKFMATVTEKYRKMRENTANQMSDV
jgi:hypothetical protein